MTDLVTFWGVGSCIRFWNTGLEISFSGQNLMGYYEKLEDMIVERVADGWDLACKISGRSQESIRAFHVMYRIKDMWFWDYQLEKSVVNNKRPAPQNETFPLLE